MHRAIHAAARTACRALGPVLVCAPLALAGCGAGPTAPATTPTADTAATSAPSRPASEAAPVIGILGGMGPAATADLYEKIIAATPARRDQEHARVVIWADPTVPDRTEALLGNGPDPVPALQRGVDRLEGAGASFLVIACNTAHAFLPRLRTRVPVLGIMEATVETLRAKVPAARRVGLLATTGTLRTGLYQRALAARDLEPVLPSDAGQAEVMEAIARVKRGERGPEVTAIVARVGDGLVRAGAEVLVTGCTELPLVYRTEHAKVPVIDPTDALAHAAVARARGR
jgi:aspartate racemase